jgi:serine/threonine protein kinase
VVALTTNAQASFYYTTKKKEGGKLHNADREVLSKLHFIEKWCQSFSSSRLKGKSPWKESIENRILSQCVSGVADWLPRSVKVVGMPGQKQEGAYGKVRKVRLTKLSTIPSWMEFAGKSLKTTDEKEKRKEILLEAGGCYVKHPGIIRLSFLNPETMEGYSLWWNGGSLINFWAKYNSKVSETMNVDDIAKLRDTTLTKEELEWVATYRKNRVSLALSLLLTVAKCHDANYIHNDISTSNVLLHFDPWKDNTVYIGLCDWGLSGRVKEKEPSKYGYTTYEAMKKVKEQRKFAAPELFFYYSNDDPTNSFQVEQKKHLYSKAADAYATGWIAHRIWNEDWDPSWFSTKNVHQYANLSLKLKSLQRTDPAERASVPEVIDVLRKAPYNWKMPECCFRK